MSIGDVAARFGLATHVLRHWESVGLLSPERAGSRRRYGSDDLFTVAAILQAKEAGLALDDIRDMLMAPADGVRRDILRRHRDDLLARIAAASAALELVQHAIDCPHEDFIRCPNFRAVIAGRVQSPGSV